MHISKTSVNSKNSSQIEIRPKDKFNKWTVLRIDPANKYNYLCRCVCKIVKSIPKSNLILNKSKSCFKCSFKSGPDHISWSGHHNISGEFWSHIAYRFKRLDAKLSPQRSNITIEQIWQLYLNQNKLCSLSGLPIEIKDRPRTASLDRIDSTRHYMLNNIQWIHKDIQNMKMEKDQSYFIKLCQFVSGCRKPEVVESIKVEADANKEIAGNWTILEPDKNRKYYLICECKCGAKHSVYKGNLKSGRSTACRKCSLKGEKFPTWSGYEKINSAHWSSIKRCAINRNLQFDITKKQIWDRYINQNGKCALTGLAINLSESNADFNAGKRTASLDRIDSSIGYIQDNVQWIHKDIQDMKMNKTESRFKELCCLISRINP